MKTTTSTYSVHQFDEDHNEAGYTTRCERELAERAGADKLGAAKVGGSYYYLADETGEVYRLTPHEVGTLGAGEMDDRGVDYSLWCTYTGHLMRRISDRVRAALGMEETG